MSELYKAMKRIEDYQSTKPLYKQIAEIKGIASTARYGYDIQPQLTIPKSIADGLDEEFRIGYKNLIDIFQNGFFISKEVEDWYYGEEREIVIVDPNKSTLIVAYLLGKSLGVDLVKVV